MFRNRPRVLILGAGFAGVACASRLSARRFEVTVVDRKPHFEFLPAIHELVSQRKNPRDLRLPLEPLISARGHRFHQARVDGIAPRKQRIATSSGELGYDFLVVALGSIENDYGVPGVTEHAIGFKSVDQCTEIGERLERLVLADRPADVSVIGAGFEGIEAAGEILRRTAGSRVRLTLFDSNSRPLSTAPAAVSTHLEQLLHKADARLYLGHAVARITPRTVMLAGGSRVRSAMTIWTTGAAPQNLGGRNGLTGRSGWIPAKANLMHPEFENVFVIGDNAQTRARLSKQAYHAMAMGEHCADALLRLDRGEAPKPFRPSPRPQLISFGGEETILLHPGFGLAGPALTPLKEAVYQAVLLQLDRRCTARRALGAARRSASVPGVLVDTLVGQRPFLHAGIRRLY